MFKILIQKIYKYRLIIGLVLLVLVLILLILINRNKDKTVETNQIENITKTNYSQTEDTDINNKNKEINNETVNKQVKIVEKNNNEETEEYKIGGLTIDQIQGLEKEEYQTFVNSLNDGEIDLLPGKFDVSEYANSFENDYFKIGLFNSLDMVLGVKIKKDNEEESKQSFEDWFSKNISNKRSDIEVVWINSKT
jgi:hypothetical protein